MKKFSLACLLIISILLSSCSTRYNILSNSSEVLDNKFEEVLTLLEKEDKKSFISLFSESALRDAKDIDTQTDKLFEYFDGDVISWEGDGAYAGEDIVDEEEVLLMEKEFIVTTSKGNYRITMAYYPEEVNPQEYMGVYSLYVIASEDDIHPLYRSYDIPGVTLDVPEYMDNANMSVGGRMHYIDDLMIFCIGNKLLKSEIINKERTFSEIYEFQTKVPEKVIFYEDNVYFKLFNENSDSFDAYSVNIYSNAKSKADAEDIEFYKIHSFYVFYTLKSSNGVYLYDRTEHKSEFLIDGDISEFVFRHSKMYYVEGNAVKWYDLNKKTSEVLLETDGMEIYSLDIADDALYFCTSKDDQAYINKIDLTDGKAEVLYSGAYCDYLHTLPEGRLVFKTEEGYRLMDLSDGSVSPLFAEYDLSELYVFDDKVFFNVKNDTSEDWYQSDTVDFDAVKIEIPDDLTD